MKQFLTLGPINYVYYCVKNTIQQPTTIIENKYNDLLISLIMVLIRKLKTKKKAYFLRRYVTSRKIEGPSHVL